MRPILTGLCALALLPASAQWQVIGTPSITTSAGGDPDMLSVRRVWGDSIMDRLLLGGQFEWITHDGEPVLGMGQAKWDGTQWDSIATRIAPVAGTTLGFLRFQGRLYSYGEFVQVLDGGAHNKSIARLNEDNAVWEPLECLNPDTGHYLRRLVNIAPSDTLYATGYRASVCGYPNNYVFAYDGSAFHEWPLCQLQGAADDRVFHVFTFQGIWYMTGHLINSGQGFQEVRFIRYINGAWEVVPGWPSAWYGFIEDVSIHNDTLYVCGEFSEQTGAPGNNIAYFDGTAWHAMGEGLGYPSDPMGIGAGRMRWYHGDLYVTGRYSHAGGEDRHGGLAWWNGEQWCGFPSVFEGDVMPGTWPEVRDIAVWRDSLYICGSFKNLQNQTVHQVAQWTGAPPDADCLFQGVAANDPKVPFCVHPNPSEGLVAWSGMPAGAERVRVCDVLGRAVLDLRQVPAQLDVGSFAPGTYAVTMLARDGMRLAMARFVKR